MAELTEDEVQVLTLWAEGDVISDIARTTQQPRAAVSNVLARLCGYDRDIAARVLKGETVDVEAHLEAARRDRKARGLSDEPPDDPPTPPPALPQPPKKRGRPRKAARPPADAPPSHGPLVEPIYNPPKPNLAARPSAVEPAVPVDEEAPLAELPVLASFPQWWCRTCGGRYERPYRHHGAPERCPASLTAVLVTVTVLDGAA